MSSPRANRDIVAAERHRGLVRGRGAPGKAHQGRVVHLCQRSRTHSARRASSVATRHARIASPRGCPRVKSLVTDNAATTPATPSTLGHDASLGAARCGRRHRAVERPEHPGGVRRTPRRRPAARSCSSRRRRHRAEAEWDTQPSRTNPSARLGIIAACRHQWSGGHGRRSTGDHRPGSAGAAQPSRPAVAAVRRRRTRRPHGRRRSAAPPLRWQQRARIAGGRTCLTRARCYDTNGRCPARR